MGGIWTHNLVVIATDCIGSCKYNYRTITTTTATRRIGHLRHFKYHYWGKFPCLFVGVAVFFSSSFFHISLFPFIFHIVCFLLFYHIVFFLLIYHIVFFFYFIILLFSFWPSSLLNYWSWCICLTHKNRNSTQLCTFHKTGGCFIALMERTRSSPFSFFCEEELFGRSPTSSFSKGSLTGRDTWSNMAAYSIQNVDIECELCKRLFPGFTKFAGHPCVSNGMFIRHIY